MSKLFSNPIGQSDIEEYLADYADFSFELRVLKELRDLGLSCEHSGTYDDPITQKSREFDIRALFVLGKYKLSVNLSVECKNIQPNFPLIMHCLERGEYESYNELIFTFNPERYIDEDEIDSMIETSTMFMEKAQSIKVYKEFSLYQTGEFVAKSSDQVGRRDEKNKPILATDGGVFEKISQAINSATDLISETHELDTENDDYITLVCPVLVVPDSVLWQVKYSESGAIIGKPELINHVSYYFGKKWTVGTNLHKLSYILSHLEIVTLSELKPFIQNYLSNYIKTVEKHFDEIISDVTES